MATQARPYPASKAVIRCPACRKLIQLPALDCPHCKVDLNEATSPKKPRMGFFRIIFVSVTILFFLAIGGWLIYKAIFGGPIIPEFLNNYVPIWAKDLASKIASLFN